MPGWKEIRSSADLPAEGEPVLICVNNCFVGVGFYETVSGLGCTAAQWYQNIIDLDSKEIFGSLLLGREDADGSYFSYAVTHWAPIPELRETFGGMIYA